MQQGDGEQGLRETPVSRERIFDGKVIDVEKWTVRLPDGALAPREIVLHRGAAAVVAVDDAGFVTLVRQHRVAVGEVTLEIPAGKLDAPGEDPLVCAKRELEEETGLRAQRWQPLTVLLTTPGFSSERIALYLATGLSAAKAHPDEDEFLDVVRMPLGEAIDRVMRGELCDGKSAVGLLMAGRLLS
ncbi:MAG TPA: NUDIX hydrolase [Candidatus Onthenecus intestinigallinarum]|uniref:NUDIX hydrolase n=1 Tax=Candidatus Onthenecus intestinigallinarum TaxID=2840875 RepID=A0A9D0ZCQ5_9FIRM|nr:NUDIX hydrolase [Candidatus Onthenecus intestinigallinarum]